ncbi:hypothetical protein JHW43_008941 [Diplocarpon mali]|nr:hypothetical protein JHW43_008941 [Diplocarpon mali]
MGVGGADLTFGSFSKFHIHDAIREKSGWNQAEKLPGPAGCKAQRQHRSPPLGPVPLANRLPRQDGKRFCSSGLALSCLYMPTESRPGIFGFLCAAVDRGLAALSHATAFGQRGSRSWGILTSCTSGAPAAIRSPCTDSLHERAHHWSRPFSRRGKRAVAAQKEEKKRKGMVPDAESKHSRMEVQIPPRHADEGFTRRAFSLSGGSHGNNPDGKGERLDKKVKKVKKGRDLGQIELPVSDEKERVTPRAQETHRLVLASTPAPGDPLTANHKREVVGTQQGDNSEADLALWNEEERKKGDSPPIPD